MSKLSSCAAATASASSPAAAAATATASAAITSACGFSELFADALLFALVKRWNRVGNKRLMPAHRTHVYFVSFAALVIGRLFLYICFHILQCMFAAVLAILIPVVGLVAEAGGMHLTAGRTLPEVKTEDMQSVLNFVRFAANLLYCISRHTFHFISAGRTGIWQIRKRQTLLAVLHKEER